MINLQLVTDITQSIVLLVLVLTCIRDNSYKEFLHRKNIDPTYPKPPPPPAPPPKKCSCGCDNQPPTPPRNWWC